MLYNGNGGAAYSTINLSGSLPDQDGSGFGALQFATPGLQNGSPDGFALADSQSAVRQFLSYEGSFTAADGIASGQISVDVGVSEPAGTQIGQSLQLTGSGTCPEDFLWTGPTSQSPGSINNGQTFGSNSVVPVINEFVANHTSTDTFEFIEIFGEANKDYSALTLLQIEGDGSGSGVVDSVHPVGTTDTAGFWTTGFLNNLLENGTITLLLVENFSGAVFDDLDTNDDGTFDVTPWTAILDSVAVNDGGSGDRTYSNVVLTRDLDGGAFAPGGASRIPNGTDSDAVSDWMRNDFDGFGLPGFTGSPAVGEAVNTPGATNVEYVPPAAGVCGDPATKIHFIQGDGLVSLEVGNEHTVEAVVVGDFQNNGQADNGDLNGFYLQEEDGDVDGNDATSEGIFIFAPGPGYPDVSVGDKVRVKGTVAEFVTSGGASSLTQLSGVSDPVVCSPTALPTPATVNLPVTALSDFERHEGMSAVFPQTLVISEYFNFDRFGEIVLTTERQFQPTAIFEPGTPEAAALAQKNALSRITLDDGRSSQNPDPAIHPNGQVFDLNNLFRGGDTVQNATGVIDDTFGLYRIHPIQGATYTEINPRVLELAPVGGDVTVASFNVLNYFTTLNSRGARDQTEFDRQRDKIFAALRDMDADIVGLIEIENNTEAIADLVYGLNELIEANTYAYIDTGVIGPDEIKVAFIYKPATVTPVGNFAVLNDLAFLDPNNLGEAKNRPALAQTFESSSSGKFTVVVNHLKSKGSGCGPGDDDPEQGNCNLTRTLAAQRMVDWLATDPTGSGDLDFLIIGDLNAYDKEDPIDAVRAGPDDVSGTGDDYRDLVDAFLGENAYSYVFDGQLGYLDHALANQPLYDQVTGATVWHINADEPDILDYTTRFKQDAQDALYENNAFRSSDHDPVLVGLGSCESTPPTFDSLTVTPDLLWPPNHKYREVETAFTISDNDDPNPTVTLVSVTSNEPDNGLGDGDTPNDIVIIDDQHFNLRAERAGNGRGREYTITYQVQDSCGNTSLASVVVSVPLNKSGGKNGSVEAALAERGLTLEDLDQQIFLPLIER